MIDRLFNWLSSLFSREPIRLAIVRRYEDANGSYVGELYMQMNGFGYAMIGASLDTLPLGMMEMALGLRPSVLDTENDFLAPMPLGKLRVGSLEPKDNERVRQMIRRLPKKRITLEIQNRFIEHVLGKQIC